MSLEGPSHTTVTIFRNMDRQCRNIPKEVKEMAKAFSSFRVSLTKRTGNKVAGALAKEGRTGKTTSYSESNITSKLFELLCIDSSFILSNKSVTSGMENNQV